MSAFALPRVRAKRRKIKPPGPLFWWALAWVVWDAAFATWDFTFTVLDARDGDYTMAGLMALVGCAMVWLLVKWSWPRFRRELAKWKADQ